MQTSQLVRLALFAATFCAAAPAMAQDPDGLGEQNIFDRDHMTVVVGAAYAPRWDGSKDYSVDYGGAIAGKIGGVTINPRIAGLSLDFINDKKDSKIGFALGPVAQARLDRHSGIHDPVVFALGKKNIAAEVGVNTGFSVNRITNPYDTLSFGVDVTWDVANAYKGNVIRPNMSYLTPVSHGQVVALSVSAEHVDDKFANYYFSVPVASVSGLPAYTARGGWKNVSAALLTGIDLDGDLTNGGFALVIGGGYSRLLGQFKDSPIVSLRGKPDQWTGAVGVAYTF